MDVVTSRVATLLRALLPIAVLQAVFWTMVTAIEHRQAALPSITQVHAQKLLEYDHRLIDSAAWQSITLPTKSCAVACQNGYSPYAVFRHTFHLPQVPTQAWGVYLPNYKSSAAVFANETLLAELGTLQGAIADRQYHPELIAIPLSVLRVGTNTVDVIVAENVQGIGRLHAFHVGPRALLQPAWYWADTINVRSQVWATAIFAVIILLAVGVQFNDRSDWTFGWFAALVFCCAALSQHSIFSEPLHNVEIKFMWFFVATFGVFASAVGFAVCLAGRKLGWIDRLAIITLVMGAVATVVAFKSHHPLGVTVGNAVHRTATLIVIPLVLWRIVQAFRGRRSWALAWVYAIFSVAAASAITDVARSWSSQMLTIRYSNIGLALLVLAFCIELGRRYGGLLGTVARSRQVLAQTLVEERQRIMRDVHDGVGGKLAGLLLTARTDESASPALRQGLQDSIQDLRLVIDSLDDVAVADTAIAFAMFRDRVAPWLAQHNIELHWHVEIPSLQGFGSERMLQIYRVLQEACNNAVRHAYATQLEVNGCVNHQAGTIELAVADNGVGLGPGYRRGRGMDNMRIRIEALGGLFRLIDQGTGLRIEASVPIAVPNHLLIQC